jgi:hypothetical protein
VSIQTIAKGIIGQASGEVFPDTVVFVEPMMASLQPGDTQQFTAKAYTIRNKPFRLLTDITSFNWDIPTIPGIGIFNVASVNSTGLVTMSGNTLPGLMTFLTASVPNTDHVGVAGLLSVDSFIPMEF